MQILRAACSDGWPLSYGEDLQVLGQTGIPIIRNLPTCASSILPFAIPESAIADAGCAVIPTEAALLAGLSVPVLAVSSEFEMVVFPLPWLTIKASLAAAAVAPSYLQQQDTSS